MSQRCDNSFRLMNIFSVVLRVCVSRLEEEVVLGTDRDSVWLLDEETGQPMAVPLATIALEMTPVQVAMPSPPSGASGREGDRMTERPCDEVG